MRIMNRTRGTLLGTNVLVADTWWRRLRGFLFRPKPMPGEGVLLAPCDAIHTWGMTFPLDVIFLNGEGEVVRALPEVPPRRTCGRVPGARYVLEVPAGTIEATGTAEGDAFSWTRVPAVASGLLEIS